MTPVEQQQIVNAIQMWEALGYDPEADRETILDGVTLDTGLSRDAVIEVYDKPAGPPQVEQQVEQTGDEEDSPVVQPVPEAVVPKPNKFREIAIRAMERGETRILPIAAGGKNPLVKWKGSELDTYSLNEWNKIALDQIDIFAKEFPDANACVIAKPDEFDFVDCDTYREFVTGYEAFSGEKFPVTYTTSARDNRVQIHFRQTDKTREMGNIVQFTVDGIDLSVRQRNEYVLAEGSNHPKGSVYQRIVDAPIISMPDKMVEYVEHLWTKAHPGSFRASSGSIADNREPIDVSIDGPKTPHGQHDATLFRIACSLRQKNEKTEDEALEHLIQVCQVRCENHGTDYVDMCQRKIKSAWKYSVVPKIEVPFGEGYEQARQKTEAEAAAKAEADAAAKAQQEEAARQQAEADAASKAQFGAQYAQNLADAAANASNNGNSVELTFKYPAIAGSHRDYVVAPKLGQTEGWFPLGDPSLVGGSSGSGKTTWVMEILEKQAQNESVYGHRTYERPYLVLMHDRGNAAFNRTMERMNLDPTEIPIKRLPPITGDAALLGILNKIEEDGQNKLPQVVFIEGADMLVEDANKGQFVVPFMSGIQDIAEHYHIAFILSVGAPKMRIGEGYVAKRDSILGSEKWSRMAEAVVALQYVKGDDTDEKRECFVMLRNAPPENFRLIMQGGRLMIHTETSTEQVSKTPEIVWFRTQAELGKTDPTKEWWTTLDMERDMDISHATAKRWIADAHAKGYIVKKRGPDNKVKGKAPQYQWNGSKTNPLWRDPDRKPDISFQAAAVGDF